MNDSSMGRVRLTVDGISVEVDAGTSVVAAIALSHAATGTRIRGTRMSVSGEPRAALCGMGVCQECRVTVDGRAYVLACQTLCRDGQVVETSASKNDGNGGT